MRVLVIGDSMVKYLPNYLPPKLSNYEVHVKSFSGITIEGLSREISRLHEHYDFVLIHVGTNNWRDSADMFETKYNDLFREILKLNPQSVIISLLVMRDINLHLSFQEQKNQALSIKNINELFVVINTKLANICKARKIFFLCRSDSLKGYTCRDGVHLNYQGNRKLADFFTHCITEVVHQTRKGSMPILPTIGSVSDFPPLTPPPVMTNHFNYIPGSCVPTTVPSIVCDRESLVQTRNSGSSEHAFDCDLSGPTHKHDSSKKAYDYESRKVVCPELSKEAHNHELSEKIRNGLSTKTQNHGLHKKTSDCKSYKVAHVHGPSKVAQRNGTNRKVHRRISKPALHKSPGRACGHGQNRICSDHCLPGSTSQQFERKLKVPKKCSSVRRSSECVLNPGVEADVHNVATMDFIFN